MQLNPVSPVSAVGRRPGTDVARYRPTAVWPRWNRRACVCQVKEGRLSVVTRLLPHTRERHLPPTCVSEVLDVDTNTPRVLPPSLTDVTTTSEDEQGETVKLRPPMQKHSSNI